MRTGVLSDDVIRNSYPEFFPLEMGLHDAVEEVVFEKHHLTGIRLPKEYKRRRNTRFPINDINNFTMLGAGADTKERNVYEAIQAYRKRFGSSNYYEDASQNKQYNDIMYMGKNYEMRRRGLISDKLNMDSLPQTMIMSRMLSRNKDEIIDMNKKTRSSTMTMTRLENDMNTRIMSNLEGAKAMLLQVAPEQRRTAQFMEALSNVSLQTRYRLNRDYMTTESAIEQSNIYNNMELKVVDLPTDAKYKYGSARDVVLEDEYLRLTGLDRPEESIKEVTTEREAFYNLKPKPKILKIKASSSTIVPDLDETDLPYEPDVGNLPNDPDGEIQETEPIPEDLTEYINEKHKTQGKSREYMAKEERLKKRLDEINERMEEVNRLNQQYGEGYTSLSNHMVPDAYRLSPYSNRITLTAEGDPWTKTNIRLTDQAIASEKREEIRDKKKEARTMMLEAIRLGNIPHHGEADVDGSGYVRIHPTNSLLPSILNPTPPRTRLSTSASRSRLERAISYSSSSSDPLTAQEAETLRRLDDEERLLAQMVRAQAREQEHDAYFSPD